MSELTSLAPAEQIQTAIVMLRGQRVLLDSDLATLYGVATKDLNRAVKRHEQRFPPDFMFQLSADEAANLRSQFGISNSRGGRRHLPYAFTEQGVAMLSSVLNSERAVLVNIEIMRTFVRLRGVLATQTESASRLEAVEREVGEHGKVLEDVVAAIRAIIARPAATDRRIGFRGELTGP